MKEIYINVLSDFNGTLGEFRKIINKLIKEHGTDSNISFDAGYNNVQVFITKKDK